jgi:hypothetical protein
MVCKNNEHFQPLVPDGSVLLPQSELVKRVRNAVGKKLMEVAASESVTPAASGNLWVEVEKPACVRPVPIEGVKCALNRFADLDLSDDDESVSVNPSMTSAASERRSCRLSATPQKTYVSSAEKRAKRDREDSRDGQHVRKENVVANNFVVPDTAQRVTPVGAKRSRRSEVEALRVDLDMSDDDGSISVDMEHGPPSTVSAASSRQSARLASKPKIDYGNEHRVRRGTRNKENEAMSESNSDIGSSYCSSAGGRSVRSVAQKRPQADETS